MGYDDLTKRRIEGVTKTGTAASLRKPTQTSAAVRVRKSIFIHFKLIPCSSGLYSLNSHLQR